MSGESHPERPDRASTDATIADTERWFVRRGLPHFIADYTATEEVLPRTIPVLTLSFLVSVTIVVEPGGPLWRNGLAVLVAFLVLVGLWGVVNRARGRPAMRLPDTVGPVEVGVFLFGPAVLGVLIQHPRVAGWTIVGNVAQLVAIYYSTSYGLVPMTVWAVTQIVAGFDIAVRLVGRTFPILLLAVTFLLFNATVWRSITRTPLPRYLLLLALFLSVTVLFLYRGIGTEFETISNLDSSEDIRDLCANSPVSQIAETTEIELDEIPPLTRNERLNVVLMATIVATEYVAVVTLLVLVFFVLFGLLAIPVDVESTLTEFSVEAIVTVRFLGVPITLTRSLIRVSGFLAVFSGLYFAVHAITDRTFRQELDGSLARRVRETLAVRAVYYALRDRDQT